MRWLVDASNVIGSVPDGWWRDREGAARRLIAQAEAFAERSGDAVTVVLDAGPEELATTATGFEVVIAPRRGRDAADDEIVRLLHRAIRDEVRVVTSDAELARRSRALGAEVVGARRFRNRLEQQPQAVEPDYDERPERFGLARDVLRRHAAVRDIHPAVAARFAAEDKLPVLDVGCGEGELASHLPDGAWVGVDSSPAMVARAPAGARLAEADALPYDDGSFPGVALLYVLYHLDRPQDALAEARRVMRPGGLAAVAVPSRHDSPELAFALPTRVLTFDAELAPGMLREHFDEIEVDTWDLPLLTLPDRDAVRDYLIGKGTPPDTAHEAAQTVGVPLEVTKRGALVWARAGGILRRRGGRCR